MRTAEQWQEVRRQVELMLEDGVSLREIARSLGISRGWVGRNYKGRGWTYVEAGEYRAIQRWAADAKVLP